MLTHLTHLTRSPTLTRTWRSLGAPLARSAHTLFLGAQGDYTTSPGFYYPKRDQLPAVMPCYRIIDDEIPGSLPLSSLPVTASACVPHATRTRVLVLQPRRLRWMALPP